MEINDSLHMFKDSISREFLELKIVSKSWIDFLSFIQGEQAQNLVWDLNTSKKQAVKNNFTKEKRKKINPFIFEVDLLLRTYIFGSIHE